jgi:hypothetical protein
VIGHLGVGGDEQFAVLRPEPGLAAEEPVAGVRADGVGEQPWLLGVEGVEVDGEVEGRRDEL